MIEELLENYHSLTESELDYLKMIPCTYILMKKPNLYKIGVFYNFDSELQRIKEFNNNDNNELIEVAGIVYGDLTNEICNLLNNIGYKIKKNEWVTIWDSFGPSSKVKHIFEIFDVARLNFEKDHESCIKKIFFKGITLAKAVS
jgi:hypothetical protein